MLIFMSTTGYAAQAQLNQGDEDAALSPSQLPSVKRSRPVRFDAPRTTDPPTINGQLELDLSGGDQRAEFNVPVEVKLRPLAGIRFEPSAIELQRTWPRPMGDQRVNLLGVGVSTLFASGQQPGSQSASAALAARRSSSIFLSQARSRSVHARPSSKRIPAQAAALRAGDESASDRRGRPRVRGVRFGRKSSGSAAVLAQLADRSRSGGAAVRRGLMRREAGAGHDPPIGAAAQELDEATQAPVGGQLAVSWR